MKTLTNGTNGRPAIVGPDGTPFTDGFPIPRPLTFSGIYGGANRTYRSTWDEALRHNRSNARAMLRDCFIQAKLQERWSAVLSQKWHIETDDEDDPEQAEAVEWMTRAYKSIPRLRNLRLSLLKGVWYGRAGAQLLWGKQVVSGRMMAALTGHSPVNGDKINYDIDGNPCVLINAQYQAEYESMGADVVRTDRGPALLLRNPSWRQRFAVYVHETEDMDYLEPELAGAGMGSGIRGKVYWCWYLRDELLSWLIDASERIGTGVWVYYFEAGNSQSETEARDAAEKQSNRNVILWPRPIGSEKQGAMVEFIAPNSSGLDSLRTTISDYFENNITLYIIGQTASHETESTGLGSNQHEFKQDTKARLIAGDLENLGECETADILMPMFRRNYPVAQFRIRLAYDMDRPDPEAQLAAAKTVFDMGAELDEDEVLGLASLSRPDEGARTLKQKEPTPPGLPGMPGNKDNPDLGGNSTVPNGTVENGKREEKEEKAAAFGRRDEPMRYGKDGEPHKFSSTQFNLPPWLARQVLALGRTIADKDLAEEGREETPHITVKYGLHTQDADDVEGVLYGFAPTTVGLGEVSIFETEEADVVKIDVMGMGLHRLNDLLSSELECTDTHPEYRPHITLAYVKPGMGKRYAGHSHLTGLSVTLDKVTFSDKEGNKTEIRLLPRSFARAGEPERYKKDRGRWITIGAKEGADGEKHGGSPVYIENGRITKKHSVLEDIPDERSTRTQNKQEAEYQRAVWAKKARKAGMDAASLHSFAKDILAHDKEFKDDITAMLKETRWKAKQMGANVSHLNKAFEGGDYNDIKGMDVLSREMSEKYPHLLGAHGYETGGYDADASDASEKLFGYLQRGNPEYMTEDQAYREAFDHMEARKSEEDAAREDEEVPFARRGGPSRYEAQHAPAGGVTVQGTFYKGGEFIPGDVMAKASASEKKAVKGGGKSKAGGIVGKDKVGGKGEKKPAKDEEPEEWDGVIDATEVESSRRQRSDFIEEWNYVDGRDVYEQQVYLQRGEYQVPGGDVIDVFRWRSETNDGDLGDVGDWTVDEDEAVEGGREYARENNMELPSEEEDEEEIEDEDEEEEEEEEEEIEDEDESDEDEPPPVLPKKQKLGKSNAAVRLSDAVSKEKASAMLAKLFPDLDEDERIAAVASTVGMPDDAIVRISEVGPYVRKYSDDSRMPGAVGIRVTVAHSKLKSGNVSRFIGIDRNGKKFIKNEILIVEKEHQKSGIGLEIFARQVENASEQGFDYISTHAAGGPKSEFNGYYTWPRFGYNESLSSIERKSPKLAEKIRDVFPDARHMRDVMATKEGRDWWKANGRDLYNAKFDLKPNSWSQYILSEYLAEKKER